MLRSIRWRIALPYILLIIATMLVVAYSMSDILRRLYFANLETRLTDEGDLLREQVTAKLMDPDSDPASFHDLAAHWSQILNSRVTIIAADGTVLGDLDEDEKTMENHLSRPEVQQAASTGKGISTRLSTTLGYEMFYVALKMQPNGENEGYIRLAVPFTDVQLALNRIRNTLVFVTILATLGAVLLALWIASRTTLALRSLTQAAERISEGDLRIRIVPTSSDEVGKLTKAFNLMSVQLESEINALESERSKMAAVLSHMNDGVIIVDGDSRIQLINPAAQNVFEVVEEQALGRTLIEVFRLHQLVELWQECLEAGDIQTMNIEIPRRQLFLQGIATPLGQFLPGSIMLLFQNLTRVRQLETVRRDFISNISHELRTPLASLKALTETLQESALDDPPAAHRFLEQMETEVDSMSLMVTELLELSKIESGKVPFNMQPTPPEQVIGEAVERLKLQAERAGLQLDVEIGEVPEVLADQNRLEQVLVNLLHNAIKFTPPGGNISVSASLYNEPPAKYVLFTVQDSGIGIPSEDLPRIFERFYKTDRARSGGGTGLGLAIARHTVEAHNGRIWAESIEGRGSTFYFTIPIANPE